MKSALAFPLTGLLVLAACSDRDPVSSTSPGEPSGKRIGSTPTRSAPVAGRAERRTEATGFEAGPLGAVEIAAGEAVQIRSLLAHTLLGRPQRQASGLRGSLELAVEDFGGIHGREVDLGESLDAMCSGEGGRAAAEAVVAEPQVVGVIGTSCSAAAVEASPLLSAAGLVMISPSNTSPALTSDLAGNASPGYHPGYFRTASNDLYEANAVAGFAYNELGLRKMATIDDGDAYTRGLTVAFGNAFRALGGEVPATARIEKGTADMTDILEEFAQAEPDGIFFPLFGAEATLFAEQAQAAGGLDEAALFTASAMLLADFLALPQSQGVYIAGPEPVEGSNVNEATGRSAGEVLEAFTARHGESPGTPFWVHAYDAGTLLLTAVEAVGEVVDGTLYVDRAALREKIGATEGFEGLLGTLSCDDFGDCGTGRVNIYHHSDPEITDPAQLPVVYRFAP